MQIQATQDRAHETIRLDTHVVTRLAANEEHHHDSGLMGIVSHGTARDGKPRRATELPH